MRQNWFPNYPLNKYEKGTERNWSAQIFSSNFSRSSSQNYLDSTDVNTINSSNDTEQEPSDINRLTFQRSNLDSISDESLGPAGVQTLSSPIPAAADGYVGQEGTSILLKGKGKSAANNYLSPDFDSASSKSAPERFLRTAVQSTNRNESELRLGGRGSGEA